MATCFELQSHLVLSVFLFFALILVFFSVKSVLGGVGYLAYFRQELTEPTNSFTPFATVIAPCKGLDEGLRENLSALLELDYPEYEVIFVVDDEHDPAVPMINEFKRDGNDFSAKNPVHPVRMIVAKRSADSSQKVENIREAVRHAEPHSEVFVFVDSDARPQPTWLKHLVAPLQNAKVGAATGYRWFLSRTPTLASELRSAWNGSIASALGPNMKSNFCWGGSMAVRREVWEKLDVSKRLKGTLSDDFTVTRAMKEAELEIRFVPQALTPSIENCTWRELFEFTTRQMKITRVYATPLWMFSFFGSALFCGVMLTAFLSIIFSRSNDLAVWVSIATLTAVSVLSIGKAWLRLKAVSLVIPTAKQQLLPQLTLWLLAPPLFLWNCFGALFSRAIRWRESTYIMHSPTKTERID